MDASRRRWYFSTMRHVAFHRTKYGRELLVDAARVREMPGFIRANRAAHSLEFHDILLVTRGTGALLLDGLREGWLAEAQGLGCVAIVANFRVLDDAVIAEAHAGGLRVASYTVNEPREAQRLLDDQRGAPREQQRLERSTIESPDHPALVPSARLSAVSRRFAGARARLEQRQRVRQRLHQCRQRVYRL